MSSGTISCLLSNVQPLVAHPSTTSNHWLRLVRMGPLRHFRNEMAATDDAWPELPYEAWRPTLDTLHMYVQVIGKVRLALAPMEPQWGQVPLYVTARGLNTSPIPHPAGVFDIDVDLIDHVVAVRTVRGAVERIQLEPRSVADFYAELMRALAAAGVPVTITELPSEVPDPIPFPDDVEHASYEPEFANRFWRVLVSVDAVLKEHRAQFRGKASPVQFFWGTFDLTYSRFSGRSLEPPPDADVITRYGADAEQACGGILARRRESGRADVLRLHVPERRWNGPGNHQAAGRALECRDGRVPPPVRGGEDSGGSASVRCSSSSRRRTEQAQAQTAGTRFPRRHVSSDALPPAQPLSGRTAWGRSMQTPLREFLRTETGGAAVLLAATAAALVWVNVDPSSYEDFWTTTPLDRPRRRGRSRWISITG